MNKREQVIKMIASILAENSELITETFGVAGRGDHVKIIDFSTTGAFARITVDEELYNEIKAVKV